MAAQEEAHSRLMASPSLHSPFLLLPHLVSSALTGLLRANSTGRIAAATMEL